LTVQSEINTIYTGGVFIVADIIFFEKTGCINNTKQKELLTLAGHSVRAVDLIKHNWEKEEILMFFNQKPVTDWFNMMAPLIKSGEIIPVEYSKEEAIALLLKEHILIKRPLMIINGEYIVGFDKEYLDKFIGLKGETERINELIKENIVKCPMGM
jgi:arsenate reductase (glutaredoxin)